VSRPAAWKASVTTSATRPLARGRRVRKRAGHVSGRPTRRASSSFGWREPGRASRRLLRAGVPCGVSVVMASGPVSTGRPAWVKNSSRARASSIWIGNCDLGILESVASSSSAISWRIDSLLISGQYLASVPRAARMALGPLARRRCSRAESPRALGASSWRSASFFLPGT